MNQKRIKICGTNVHPGEKANLALPLPEHYSCSPLFMPIKVIHGVKEGPCLVIFSVLKGTELNGLEISNRLINSINPKEVNGTIITIPVMNVYGLIHYPLTLPTGNDLTKCFPGNEQGSYGERIAHLITTELLKKADYCIELQTGGINYNILPQVYCNFDDLVARKLAKVFNSPVITNVNLTDNNLRQTTEELQVPLLVYQAGEALRFDENAISLGIQGVKNIMNEIGLVSYEPSNPISSIFSRDADWVIAHRGGILYPEVTLGQTVEENDIIGMIKEPFGSDASEPIKSSYKGVVVGINTAPLIYEGLSIFKITQFLDDSKAETVIEEWDKLQPQSFTN